MTAAQTARHKKTFLGHFRVLGNVTAAARVAGIERRRVYDWQEHDDHFAAAYRDAEIEATETLEAEAHRRAAIGVPKGKVVTESIRHPNGDETGLHVIRREESIEYSDTLLIFLLKARAPEKYRERVQLQHADADGEKFPLSAIRRALGITLAD